MKPARPQSHLGESLMLRSFRLPVSVLGFLLLTPALASADTYVVGSCKDQAGKHNAAAGWVAAAGGDGATVNTCATNGHLIAGLNSPTPSGASTASWSFPAPPNTHIVRLVADRTTSGFQQGGPAQDVAYVMTVDDAALERCQPANDLNCNGNLTGTLDKPGLTARQIAFRLLCTDAGGSCSKQVGMTIASAFVTLEDPAPPTVTNSRVIDSGESSGMLRVGFDATDAGGGVYRALVKVDGQVTQTIPLAPAPCSDVVPGANPYEFDVPVPCPPTVKDALVGVDVRALPAGPHGVEVVVEDAAGNQAAVAGPIEFPKPNVASGSAAERAAALTGRLRMWFVKARSGNRRSFASTYGTRVVTRGVLRSRSGRGIVGARIDVYHIRRDGTRRLVKTGLKSRSRGRLTLILPNNVDTRTIEFAYRALRPGPVTSSQRLRLKVRTRSGRTYYRKSSGRR
jgi:hypothetical protein